MSQPKLISIDKDLIRDRQMQVLQQHREALKKRSGDSFCKLLKGWRKQRKLSQLDFSLEAGLSQRHLSFLESGRSKPSREMVMQLCQALELALRETNQLLQAAGFAPVYQQRDLDSEEMASVNNVLKMMLSHHEPFPALVADRGWNLLMANDAANRLIGLMGDKEDVWSKADPSGKKNVYRMTFSESGMKPLISNWDIVEKSLIQRLIKDISLAPDHQELASLYEEISEQLGSSSLNFNDMINDSAPVLPVEMSMGGVTLCVYSVISSFGTAQDITADELKIETFFPADEFTKQFFERLAGT